MCTHWCANEQSADRRLFIHVWFAHEIVSVLIFRTCLSYKPLNWPEWAWVSYQALTGTTFNTCHHTSLQGLPFTDAAPHVMVKKRLALSLEQAEKSLASGEQSLAHLWSINMMPEYPCHASAPPLEGWASRTNIWSSPDSREKSCAWLPACLPAWWAFNHYRERPAHSLRC